MARLRSNYKILGLVGRGQFGKVFAAIDRHSGSLVALKELKPQQLSTSDFLRELNFLVTLDHFNIVSCKALEHRQHNRYLVMDYCEGGTLRTLLDSSPQLSWDLGLKLVVDILSGLEYAHDRSIIHRDIKPENILLKISDRAWTAHISDFGIAKLHQVGGSAMGDTGSPAYMAPEQFYGQYSYSCDLYAVGIILYELVVGERPFSGMPQELLSAHLNQPVVIPKDVPFLLRSTIAKSLQKMPQRRFATAALMRESLQLVQTVLAAKSYNLDNLVSDSTITPVSEFELPYRVTHLAIASKYVYLGSRDCLHLLSYGNCDLGKIVSRRSLLLDREICSLQPNLRGCFIVTSASIYYLPQDTTSDEFCFVAEMLPIASFPTNDLVCAIDPQGYWLGVSYLPRKSKTPAFEVFKLPNCQLKEKQINRKRWHTLIALNSRRGLGIYQKTQNTEFHLFDRRGNWLANFTAQIKLDLTSYNPSFPQQILATETNNPGAAIAIALDNFRIERIEVDLAPVSIASCSKGYLLSDRQRKIALIDGDNHNVRYDRISLSPGFEVTAIATSDTQLLIASAKSDRSYLQQSPFQLLDL